MTLVDTLLKPLDDAGVSYCVLRNYGFVEGKPLDNDVDVLVPSRQRARADSVLEELGFVKCRDEPTRHTFYLRVRPESTERDVLHVCWDDVMYNTLPVADGERLLANSVEHESAPVRIPSDEDAFVQLTFHCVLNRGFFKDRYVERLTSLGKTVDRETVYDHATDLFGRPGKRAVDAVFDGDFDEALSMKWRLVVSNGLRRPTRLPRFLYVLFVYYQLSRPLKRFDRRYNPVSPTPTIALLGPDGSGKSTLSRRLESDLTAMGVDAKRVELGVYNDQTWFIAALQRVHDAVTGYDPDGEKTDRRRGALELDDRNGLVKSALYFVDQLSRYLLANASGRDVLVADRYIDDVVLYHHPLFARLLPLFESDRVRSFVLNADGDVIADRSEYDRASVEEMRDRLSVLAHDRVDVSRSLSEIRTDLWERIASSSFVAYLK